ncbi:MAG: UDP-N-acetylmuramoyl-L-alanyl-D-glutamate--2,6-diaminopimelate ligase, partial [Bacteroidia bacterium]|nr:UDP-N-acetylmuramoyl-L-alanyl-D-glutamate--2,6-diaminopimelate ligase [Bacteroidia bacterium]
GRDAFALTNRDDKNGMVMLQNTKASKYSYSLRTMADFRLKVLESDFNGMLLKIDEDEAWFNMVGNFNAYNILAVYATAFILDVPRMDIITKMTLLGRVNGRFEVYRSAGKITGIVDYAHTPDALDNVIKTINEIRSRNEQLITVIGCGGNRDKAKRPVMAKVAVEGSDKVILTSDNPRDEEPSIIIAEMMEGVDAMNYKKTLSITDRKEAIKTAVMLSKPGDIILIAGKGHEAYQEIKGEKHPFDDRKILTELFNQGI